MGWGNISVQDVLSRTRDFDGGIDSSKTSKEFGLSFTVECFICGREELANRGIMPNGWRIVKEYEYILCPDCAQKLKERCKK